VNVQAIEGQKARISSSITSGDKEHSGNKASELGGNKQSESLLRHSSADDMALGHMDRRSIGSHPKAGIAVGAKRKIPLTAGNLTLVVQPSATTYLLTITETNPSSHSNQNFLHISLILIHFYCRYK